MRTSFNILGERARSCIMWIDLRIEGSDDQDGYTSGKFCHKGLRVVNPGQEERVKRQVVLWHLYSRWQVGVMTMGSALHLSKVEQVSNGSMDLSWTRPQLHWSILVYVRVGTMAGTWFLSLAFRLLPVDEILRYPLSIPCALCGVIVKVWQCPFPSKCCIHSAGCTPLLDVESKDYVKGTIFHPVTVNCPRK